MTEETQFVDYKLSELCYGIIHNKEGSWRELTIPDCAEPDIEGVFSWFQEDEDAEWMEVVKINPDDFWRGYFYFNDMEPASNACGLECNTTEHLDIHWESNNGGGHYDCTHYEHIVDGEVVETIKHNNLDWYTDEQESERN